MTEIKTPAETPEEEKVRKAQERKLAIARESRSLQTVGLSPTNVGDLNTLANMLAKSDLVPTALRGQPANVSLVLMWAGELRIGAAQGLGSLNPIEGKVSLSAELMRGLIQRHPDCEYFEPVEVTNEKATYATKRRGRDREIRMTYTMEDAQRAKLTHKHNWQHDPKAMLSARASSRLGRAAWADVCLGLILDDEAEEIRGDRPAMTAPVPPPAEEPPKEPAAPKNELAEVLGENEPREGAFEEVPAEEPKPEELSLKDRLHAAATLEQLKSLVPEIQALAEADQAIPRAVYAGRRFDIEREAKKGQ